MDNNKILSVNFNLNELNNDLYNWATLPKNLRDISDNKCKEKYGCTNRELYNKIVEKVLFNKNLNISNINESYDYSSIDRKELITKINSAKELNDDVLIAIIYPYDPKLIDDDTYRENYKNEFIDLYNKFVKLSDKYQKYSNLYSIQLFGYNVRSMYQIIYTDLFSNNDQVFSRDYVDSSSSAIEESITENLIDKNIIELYKFKILNCNSSINEASTDDIYSKLIDDQVNECIYTNNFENAVNSIVPYFTLSEFNSIIDTDSIKTLDGIDFDNITNNGQYFNIIKELYYDFNYCKDDKKKSLIENTLLSIGWNPYVDPKYMNKVRNRQVKWFNEHYCKFIDLSNYDINNKVVTESSYEMDNLYKTLDLYPVYIITTYTNSAFSTVIRKMKKCTFTHAGLTLDSDLKTILSFMWDGKHQGFSVESLDLYLKKYNKTQIDLMCLFVDGETLKKLEDIIQYFTINKDKTKYNFKNLINIIRNKAKDNDPENISMVCSQFVDTVLKMAGIDLTNKSSNLVIPQDFSNIDNPKVYKLYTGFGNKYNEARVELKIKFILSLYEREDIRFSEFINKIQESSLNLINHRYNIIDNIKANTYLQELYEYISPINNKEINKANDEDFII